jgi:hypothetical protein
MGFYISMGKIMTALILLSLATYAQAGYSSEDRSRFQEHEYTKAEPGLLTPAEYIERAKQAVHGKYKDLHFNMYSDGKVKRRFYRNAPAQDRDMICVSFTYRDVVIPPGMNFPGFAVIRVLIRKDLSKIYINEDYVGAKGWSLRQPAIIAPPS